MQIIRTLRIDHSGDLEPHRRIALAVLRQALYDLRLPTIRPMTVCWFRSEDFDLWCEVLGVDPADVRARVFSRHRRSFTKRLAGVLQ